MVSAQIDTLFEKVITYMQETRISVRQAGVHVPLEHLKE